MSFRNIARQFKTAHTKHALLVELDPSQTSSEYGMEIRTYLVHDDSGTKIGEVYEYAGNGWDTEYKAVDTNGVTGAGWGHGNECTDLYEAAESLTRIRYYAERISSRKTASSRWMVASGESQNLGEIVAGFPQYIRPTSGSFAIFQPNTENYLEGRLTGSTVRRWDMDCPVVEVRIIDTVVQDDSSIWGDGGDVLPGTYWVHPDAVDDFILPYATAKRKTAFQSGDRVVDDSGGEWEIVEPMRTVDCHQCEDVAWIVRKPGSESVPGDMVLYRDEMRLAKRKTAGVPAKTNNRAPVPCGYDPTHEDWDLEGCGNIIEPGDDYYTAWDGQWMCSDCGAGNDWMTPSQYDLYVDSFFESKRKTAVVYIPTIGCWYHDDCIPEESAYEAQPRTLDDVIDAVNWDGGFPTCDHCNGAFFEDLGNDSEYHSVDDLRLISHKTANWGPDSTIVAYENGDDFDFDFDGFQTRDFACPECGLSDYKYDVPWSLKDLDEYAVAAQINGFPDCSKCGRELAAELWND